MTFLRKFFIVIIVTFALIVLALLGISHYNKYAYGKYINSSIRDIL